MTTIDKSKLAASILLVAAGLVVFYSIHSLPGFARGGIVLVSVVAALVLMLTTEMGSSFKGYAADSLKEAKRVTWPTRKETLQMTGVVLLFVVVLAIFMSLVDWSLGKFFYSFLLNRG
ncbi:preprotein translocase subunit SecE [Leeia sp. TBRC 13508]|uniref:Protein translocase subunit SecE n=1 Tax=Leeia speluncae TaxID=2884804 RepID=A0ABS8D6B2_9NEIS|nr:preprotein translocase subunit SecE [Leeia speluncae]MCB6183735.1 preprotein translocase subunit SecE [Leeia speluncae]